MSALQAPAWGSVVKPDGRTLIIRRVRYKPDHWSIIEESRNGDEVVLVTLTLREIEALAQEVGLL